MSTTSQQSPNACGMLGQYVDLNGLHDLVRDKYPTKASLQWFVRNHRAELAESGTLILVAGRLHFHPAKFDSFVIEAGRRLAGGSHG